MDAAKIRLSPEEASLVQRADWILTKNNVMQKAMTMLGLLQSEQHTAILQFENSLPQPVFQSSPKIARGENYQGLPWLMLDYPRTFQGHDIFAIRTFFWWGRFFSVTLHLSGLYKKTYAQVISGSFEKIKDTGFSICINNDQWQHHFGGDNYAPVATLGRSEWAAVIDDGNFIKLSKKFPLHDWNEAPKKLLEVYYELLDVTRG